MKTGKRDDLKHAVREVDDLLPIVVGANLRAEVVDRPLGYRLRQWIRGWQEVNEPAETLVPVVCTDLWYLNDRPLMGRPTISIGPPETNAVSAYFAHRLPVALVVDETLQVQLDPEYVDLQACVWGVGPDGTESGLRVFVDRYLDRFLREVYGKA